MRERRQWDPELFFILFAYLVRLFFIDVSLNPTNNTDDVILTPFDSTCRLVYLLDFDLTDFASYLWNQVQLILHYESLSYSLYLLGL
jgi:hypothetical protein